MMALCHEVDSDVHCGFSFLREKQEILYGVFVR